MNKHDKYWLDEAFKMFELRFKDPFWNPSLELHNQCSDEWRKMNGEETKGYIVDAYDHATTGAKHSCNILVEYLLESDMQGITLDPFQVMAVLDAILYLLHCDEQMKEVRT